MRRLGDARRRQATTLLALGGGMVDLEDDEARRRRNPVGERVETRAKDGHLSNPAADRLLRGVLGEAAAQRDEQPQEAPLGMRPRFLDRFFRVRAEDADRQRIGEDQSVLERLMGGAMAGGAERGAAEFTLSHGRGNYAGGDCRRQNAAAPNHNRQQAESRRMNARALQRRRGHDERRRIEIARRRDALARARPLCLLLHLAINGRYDIFRDELYFIVCGQHPALGYVDQPPLIPLIAAAFHALFGASAWPLRLVPALAMAATTALAAEYARLLGGGRFAQWLCGLAVLCAPVLLVDGLLLTTDCLQPLTWLACAWCLTRVAQTRDERWWLGFGLAAGISLAAKYLILFFLASLAVGVLATPLRRSLARPWIYLGALIAFLFLAPSLYWQAENGWPFLELGGAAAAKNIALSPLAFLGQQALFMLPPSAAIWLAGLWRFSVRPPLPALRAFPIAFVVMQVLVYLLHGKAYYLAAFYPILFAGGALAIEGWLARPISASPSPP